MKLHEHHPTSNSVKFYENQSTCIPYQVMTVGTNSLNFRQLKEINYCISETIVTNFDVHHHTIASYIITVSFMKFHPLVTRLWL